MYFLLVKRMLPILLLAAVRFCLAHSAGSEDWQTDQKHRLNLYVNNSDDEDNEAVYDFFDPSLSSENEYEPFLQILKKLDTDNDDWVTRGELRAWVEHNYHLLPRAVVEERLNFSDADGNGKVSWMEHVKESFDLNSEKDIARLLKGDYESRRLTMLKINEDRDIFAKADRDNDGALNLEEYYEFNLPEDSHDLLPLLLKHRIGERDNDGDGRLTREEYTSAYVPQYYHHEGMPENIDEFSLYDANGDQVLDNIELHRIFAPGNLNAMIEEVDHLFEEADRDEDNKLSYDEILHFHDEFLNSPVTDFGNLLQKRHDEL